MKLRGEKSKENLEEKIISINKNLLTNVFHEISSKEIQIFTKHAFNRLKSKSQIASFMTVIFSSVEINF